MKRDGALEVDKKASSSSDFEGRCKKCGKSGHRTRECQLGATSFGFSSIGQLGDGSGVVRMASSSDDRAFEQYRKKAKR